MISIARRLTITIGLAKGLGLELAWNLPCGLLITEGASQVSVPTGIENTNWNCKMYLGSVA